MSVRYYYKLLSTKCTASFVAGTPPPRCRLYRSRDRSVAVRNEMEPDVSRDASDIATCSPQALLPPPPPPPPTSIEIEKDFILTLETLPMLWDKTHTHYSNKYKRTEALTQLLKILIKIKPGATTDDVKKKINVLRSNYRRDLKKIISSRRSGSGTDELYYPKSWTFEYMKFMDKHEQPIPVSPFFI